MILNLLSRAFVAAKRFGVTPRDGGGDTRDRTEILMKTDEHRPSAVALPPPKLRQHGHWRRVWARLRCLRCWSWRAIWRRTSSSGWVRRNAAGRSRKWMATCTRSTPVPVSFSCWVTFLKRKQVGEFLAPFSQACRRRPGDRRSGCGARGRETSGRGRACSCPGF